MNLELPHRDDLIIPCAKTDPEVFHLTKWSDRAKRICASCPISTACKTSARQNRLWGTWGGETNDERVAAGFIPTGWGKKIREN
ncbi:WhiB family transcriptional regulator [Streptomyces erythrochromogenes]|uniref:WhiB family transcriptional regulator n=1 Tax=Streptomyces erythrochromogenes TaxID=285574 RepID=UPI0034267E0A